MAHRDDSWGLYAPSGRRAANGIRARSTRGTIGETWWSRRFVGLLESFNMGGRLVRGRTYARQGQVLDISVNEGVVSAHVLGSRARPYQVSITAPQLKAKEWDRAETTMASKALFLARLLAGEMPTDIEEAFDKCSVPLFPKTRKDLKFECSCPDWGDPCKHVAAALLILAEAFDRDPFLLFQWRGRSKAELLEDLRKRRGRTGPKATASRDSPPADPWALVKGEAPLGQSLHLFWKGTGTYPYRVSALPTAPLPDALLRQIDAHEITLDGQPLVDALRPAYATMSAAALRLLRGEEDTDSPAHVAVRSERSTPRKARDRKSR